MSSHAIPREPAFWEADPYRDVQQLNPTPVCSVCGQHIDGGLTAVMGGRITHHACADYDDLPIADPGLDQLLDHLLGKDQK